MEKYLLSLIQLLVTVISPELRQGIVTMLNALEKQAEKTPNKWDDVIVAMLKQLVLGDSKTDFKS